jgi:hypothetical protein
VLDRLKGRPMLVALAAGALTALGVGGVAIAQAGGGSHAKPAAQTTVRQDKADSESTGDKADSETTGDKADSESTGDKADPAGGESAKGEVPNGDGPSGHADEPANASADHVHEGSE